MTSSCAILASLRTSGGSSLLLLLLLLLLLEAAAATEAIRRLVAIASDVENEFAFHVDALSASEVNEQQQHGGEV